VQLWRRPLAAALLLLSGVAAAISGCVAGGGYGEEIGVGVGYEGDYYEPWGYDYGAWGPDYWVGPPYRHEHDHFRDHGHAPGVGGGHGAPSIPSRPHGGGGHGSFGGGRGGGGHLGH